jgi:hypothetical protein
LQRKEEAEAKRVDQVIEVGMHILHETLVEVLGLHTFVSKQDRETAEEEAAKRQEEGKFTPRPFMPAAYVMGNHHILKVLMEEKEKEDNATEAMQDEAFEAMSKRLAQGDFSDLDPVLMGEEDLVDVEKQWYGPEMQATLQAMGVSVRAPDAPQVPHRELKVDEPKPVPGPGLYFDEDIDG